MATDKPLQQNERAKGGRSDTLREGGTTHRLLLAVIPTMARVLNPLLLGHMRSRRLLMVAVIHHQGRRSGRAYSTPTSARPTPDGFVIPMTFGEQADWVRNIQAAGGCVVEWKGAHYPVGEPEIVDQATARSAFSLLERLFFPFVGVTQFLRVRHVPKSRS